MVYKRKRRYRRKKPVGKPMPPKRMRSLATTPSYFFTRTESLEIDTTVSGPFSSNMVRLDQVSHGIPDYSVGRLVNFSDFSNLFGGYKVNRIRITITPNFTNASFDTSAKAPQVLLHTLYDPFNHLGTTVTPAQVSQFQNRRTRKLLNNTNQKGLVSYFKPTMRSANDTAGVTTKYNVVRSRWNSTADSGALHYGPTLIIETVDGSLFTQNNIVLTVDVKYYLEMKQVF